ncbi:S41 family peptidase [Heyndrickxia oleronia]|uniref:S41 family peptidase n=1 Tax=Heyndrickxia oleronia TaxID=38875 RepID=UPI002041BA42|nr:S41 family peptidase [Heyndrickxia oleronia]MCM3238899.1 S41 family peptidase [Heyndrickxia oleronia]
MYIDMFEEIVSICRLDYSGCQDKKGWDHPEKYVDEICILEEKQELTPDKFVEIVQDYLLDFKEQHMFFKTSKKSVEKRYDVGFKVRRFEDQLFITDVGKEMRVKKGYAIVSLGNVPVINLVEKHRRELMEDHQERENWNSIIGKYQFCEIMDGNGHTYQMELKKYEKDEYTPQYTIEVLEKGILLMALTDFANADAITQLVHQHQEALENCRILIIDVRVNYGGNDSSYFQLLPYIFENREVNINPEDDEYMLINFTERSCELEIAEMNNAIASTEDEYTKKVLKIFLREWEKNKGKGFVQFDLSDLEDTIIQGRKNPEQIIVMTDVTCGSSGDSFVEICKRSSKVTVIGRPTAGLNDYANLAVMKWHDQFELWYPTSRLSRIDNGKGMTGVGIKPHIHIPWTPKHLIDDVDIQTALKLLEEKANA